MKKFSLALVFALGCSGSPASPGFAQADGGGPGPDGSVIVGSPDGGWSDATLGGNPDGAAPHTCNPTSQDLSGCACPTPGATRGCYTGDPKTRNVGACKDGTQTCQKSGESASFGPCGGLVTPTTESCTGTIDSNCNGKVGCDDPTCANDPACKTGCTNGATRPCYDGAPDTENVGTCKDGTQTCVNGQWPSNCSGEVLPQPENCCDPLDHDCNGLPGCFDFLSCLTSACCQTTCSSKNVDPGCVCPQGSGDTATCPDGDHDVHKGGFPGTDECCPCTASDCASDLNCCGNAVCAKSPSCGGLNCKPLPPSCNGQVSTDCDDFPEDCDEPCCKCTSCP